jgi:YD repeat-containing protein
MCGNPIAPGTGNKVQIEADFVPANPGSKLELIRTYNGGQFSGDVNAKGVFGSHWTSALDRKVLLRDSTKPMACYTRSEGITFCTFPQADASGQSAVVARPDGKLHIFNRAGSQWIGDADVNERLSAQYAADGFTPTTWNFTTVNRDVELYDANGRLLSVTSASGAWQRYTYSTGASNDTSVARSPDDAPVCSNVQAGPAIAAGLPICVTDNWGRQMQFEYDSKQRVTKAIDAAGQAYLYEYDGVTGGCPSDTKYPEACRAGNLTAVTFPGSQTKKYHYNERNLINGGGNCYNATSFGPGSGHLPNALTGITDENGARYATWNWNCYNQATSSEHAGGVEKVSLAYTGFAADGTKTVTVTSYVGTAAAPQPITRKYHYKLALGVAINDAIDQPCEGCQDMMERTYDTNNNVSTSKDWQGNKKVFTYDLTRNLETSRVEGYGTPLARTITTEWHPTMRLRARIAEPLRITSYTYDASGNMLSESVQATKDVNGASGFSAAPDGARKTWNFTYNAAGQLLTKTGPGVNTTLTYDNQGNLETMTNAASHVTRYGNYDVNGRVGQITDPNGLVTTFAYGPRGWLDSVSSGGEVTSYAYDSVGNLKTVTMPDRTTTTYSYDDAHRLTSIADSLGNKISYALDLTGNRIAEDRNDAAGQLTSRISRVFDTFNRLKQVTGAVQ